MKSYYKNDIIINLVKEKNVLHIGACDSPYSKQRFLNGSLLHYLINNVGNEVIGLDIDQNSIEELRELGLNNIFWGDIVNDKYAIDLKTQIFDYIILGDIIEHLENPGLALVNIKKLMTNRTKVIVTVPNCFSYGAIKNLIKTKEEVHPDHVFWTSKTTMEKLLSNQGFSISKFYYCFYGSKKLSRFRKKASLIFLKRFPRFLPCLFFEVSLNASNS